MSRLDDNVKFLYDDKGKSLGVWMSPELWNSLDAHIEPLLHKLYPECFEDAVIPEPVDDLNMLKEYWDFPYPPDGKVHCEHCGASTEDWESDDPRVFRLKAANLGGLVTFECQQCSSRITKRHFKDKVTFECKPPVDRKSR
ncbi:hypothetical protein JCM16814_18570 [Desulfobaculum senezii]|jgi:hypothetical protein